MRHISRRGFISTSGARRFDGYDRSTGKGSLGVELACTAISSPTSLGTGTDGARQIAGFMASRPHLHYVDGSCRGYFLLDLTRQRLSADFYATDPVSARSSHERFARGFVSESGRNHLIDVSSPA